MPGALKDRPVLLLHGFGQTGQIWRPVVELLTANQTRCPDLPGHGVRSGCAQITPESMTSFVIDQASGLAKPILVGYSMGGRIAIHSVLANQSSFSALLLVSTTAGIDDEATRKLRLVQDDNLANLLERGRDLEFEAIWQKLPIWEGDPTEITEQAAKMRQASSSLGLAKAMRGFGTGSVPSAWRQLEQINLPTTIVAGARDTKYVAEATKMHELITSSELVIEPDCGHSIVWESPARIADQIERISRRLQLEER